MIVPFNSRTPSTLWKRDSLLLVMSLTFWFAIPVTSAFAQELPFRAEEVFDEVVGHVNESFWDASKIGAEWQAACADFRERAIAAKTHDEFARVMNELLADLQTSHTAYFSAQDPHLYQLLGIFEFAAPENQPGRFTYEGIGMATEIIDGKRFVAAVYDGLPAAVAGLRFGDEIVSVNNEAFHPIDSFRGKADVPVTMTIRREGPDAATEEIQVVPQQLNGRTMFETALTASSKIIERGDLRVGYVHAWSYAGEKYQEQIRDLILWGDLSTCDALVLDLRDGWGGANVDYVNLFRDPILEITTVTRDAKPLRITGVWGRPVALVVNERSRSGKELISYAFKKLQLGEVVGTTTAGAVVGGRCIPLSNQDVLYLAAADVRVDGERIEGKGVSPTIRVERPIQYANGADPQLESAVEALLSEIRSPQQ